MRNLKVISICLVTLFLSVVIRSNLSSSSSNNQAYATLEGSNTKTVESIKKAVLIMKVIITTILKV